MSNRSAARGTAAASSIRLTLRTSNAVATSNASPRAASCFAKEAVRQGRPEPPLLAFQPHPSLRLRQIKGGGLPITSSFQGARISDGWIGTALYETVGLFVGLTDVVMSR